MNDKDENTENSVPSVPKVSQIIIDEETGTITLRLVPEPKKG